MPEKKKKWPRMQSTFIGSHEKEKQNEEMYQSDKCWFLLLFEVIPADYIHLFIVCRNEAGACLQWLLGKNKGTGCQCITGLLNPHISYKIQRCAGLLDWSSLKLGRKERSSKIIPFKNMSLSFIIFLKDVSKWIQLVDEDKKNWFNSLPFKRK